MPRPESATPRTHQVKVSLTADEFERLSMLASSAGQRLAIYARLALLNRTVKVEAALTACTTDRLIYIQWQRVGQNLNQIARRLNALEHVAAREVEGALADLRRLINGAQP